MAHLILKLLISITNSFFIFMTIEAMECMLLFCTLMSMKWHILYIKNMHILTAFTWECIVHQNKYIVASRRKNRDRIKWSPFSQLLSDHQFRRHFRMDRACCKKHVKIVRSLFVEVCLKVRSFWTRCTRLRCIKTEGTTRRSCSFYWGFHKWRN